MKTYTQAEHEEINRREYPGTREICCVCSEPTGRAGRGDDSIYATAAVPFPLSPDGESCTVAAGDEIGPLCWECYERMRDVGLFEDEEAA